MSKYYRYLKGENFMNLKPKSVFKFFEEICKIPRGSGNEREISDYLLNFATNRNLEVIQDKALNIIIKKPASIGYENSPTVILQGHMDMVCEKTPDSNHDFSKDPIEHIIDGEWLRANKTTLGADNGIAMAIGMAIATNKSIKHPQIELLLQPLLESPVAVGLLNDAHDVVFTHDEKFLAIHLDLGARVLPEQHLVAGLHVQGTLFAVFLNLAVADGDDLALHRLFSGGVGNDDAAGALFFVFETSNQYTVV